MATDEEAADEVLRLTRELLDAIASGDWERYAALCEPDVTCFEPEARGERVEGLDFHRFYFQKRRGSDSTQTTLVAPRVRVLSGHAALVTYVRLTQSRDASGQTSTSRYEETRVWRRRDGRWLLAHLHRSANA